MGPDRIRRIAETMYGAIPDTDWNELTRLAGVGTGGIASLSTRSLILSLSPCSVTISTLQPNKASSSRINGKGNQGLRRSLH